MLACRSQSATKVLSPAFLFKMISIIVTILMVLFYAYLILTFFSITSLILNIIIITILYFLITRDLKDSDNHKYYVASLLLTALFLIFNNAIFINYIFGLTQKLLLSLVTVAGLLVYIFAHIVGFVYEYYHHLKQKHKR